MFSCFQYIKEIGQICNKIPFDIVSVKDFSFLPVAMDRSFHLFDCEDLKVFMESSSQEFNIVDISANENYVFTCTQKTLRSTNRTTDEFNEIEIDGIKTVLAISRFLLGITDYIIYCFDGMSLKTMFKMDLGNERKITYVYHPHGYINKILVAFDDGILRIYNINSRELVYEFPEFESPIVMIRQSPQIDTVALVDTDCRIILFNLKYGLVLFNLLHSDPIGSMSFCVHGPPYLIVGLVNGDLIVWDLNDKQVLAKLSNAHNAPITSVCCMKFTNRVITGGEDNAIRQWVLDPDCSDFLRLHKYRLSHSVPPAAIAFCKVHGNIQLIGASGTHTIISCFPLVETSANISSIKPLNPKHMVSPISSMSTTNSNRFASVATVHKDCSLVHLWDIENHRYSRRSLNSLPKDGARIESGQIPFNLFTADVKATASFLSSCGNYGLVGSSDGSVLVFVTQSSRFKNITERKHESPVIYVHTDGLNSRITSISSDGIVHYHDFHTFKYIDTMILSPEVFCAEQHPNGTLVAVSHASNVTIIDTVTRKVARVFECGSCHNLAFSHDGRFLFATGNKEIFLFNIVTQSLIQRCVLNRSVTMFAVHPNGEYIATIHENSLSTILWRFNQEKIATSEVFNYPESVDHCEMVKFSEMSMEQVKNLIKPKREILKILKAPRPLPFFLGSASNLNIDSLFEGSTETGEELTVKDRPMTKFVAALSKNEFDVAIDMMKLSTREDISMEITCLGFNGEIDERVLFVDMLIYGLESRRNYDFIQVLMSLFLNEHSLVILKDKNLRERVSKLLDTQSMHMKVIENDSSHAMCLINYLNKVQ